MSGGLDYSVVVPCYNAGPLIHRALESVFRQSIAPREVIVVDDGSSDGSADSVEQRWGGRVLCIRQANRGPSAARNRGVAGAASEWVAFLDSDDEWVETKLERQAALVHQSPQLAMVATHCLVDEGNGEVIESRTPAGMERGRLLEALRIKTAITLSSVLIRRQVFNALQGFNSSLVCGEDREMWTRVAVRYPVGCVPELLVRKYDQEEGLSRNPERTIQDGLVVNRYVDSVLRNEPDAGAWDRWTGLRRADAELYWGVAWLYQRRQKKKEALGALTHSLCLWPFDSPRRMMWRFSALFRLLTGRV